MQATIVKLLVAAGDTVVKGDLLLVLEAMKMEQPLVAHRDGLVGNVSAVVGETVSSGSVLLTVSDAA
jgi:acetyl-CoA/propionyl-CoA carboxylase biotin carboxyl carrier protein